MKNGLGIPIVQIIIDGLLLLLFIIIMVSNNHRISKVQKNISRIINSVRKIREDIEKQRSQKPSKEIHNEFIPHLKDFENRIIDLENNLRSISSSRSYSKEKSYSSGGTQTTTKSHLEYSPSRESTVSNLQFKNSYIKPSKENLRELYNSVVDNLTEHEKFKNIYSPTIVGVSNSDEIGANRSLEPNFKTASNGNYYVIEVEREFFVVPSFGLVLQNIHYKVGAIGEVFECPNYNPELRYRNIKVEKPASFKPDFSGTNWTLIKKGRLILGEGE